MNKYVLAGIALVISVAVYVTANAASKITYKITPPPSADYKDDQVYFLGAFDLDEDFVLIQLKACGSMIEMTVPKEMVLAEDREINVKAGEAVAKACK